MSDERRQHDRLEVWFPVRITAGDDKEAVGVAHDASRAAIRVSASRPLAAGERVRVAFTVVGSATAHDLEGTILRLEPNGDDPEGLWPWRITVTFDDLHPDLEPLLREGAERLKNA